MIAISIEPLAGRLHGNPWGRHVNEGAAEWPPSPWRILRCLIFTWKAKNLGIDTATARRILGGLAEPPSFHLPPASVGHTRHYMPWDKVNPGDTTLVFDSFVAVAENSRVVAAWPELSLDEKDQAVLAEWLSHVGYLGRAESWCEMSLLDTREATAIDFGCSVAESPGPESELVNVLCPDPETAFSSKHTPKSKQAPRAPIYEPDWHICGETLWLHKEKWANPPGSRWLRYVRPADCFRISPKPKPTPRRNDAPQIVRFSLDSTVLPLVTHTLPVAEIARINLMGIFGKQNDKRASEMFSGKRADGTIRTDHGHAFYLPTDEDGDGRLDHLTLVAEAGFSREDLRALEALRELKSAETDESGHKLRVLLVGMGRLDEFRPKTVIGPAQRWISATPYLSHRHPNKKGSDRDSPEELTSPAAFLAARLREDIDRLIARRADLSSVDPAAISVIPATDPNGVFRIGTRNHRPLEFKRYRRKRSDDGGRRLSGAFVLDFGCPIDGPIALGHSCHFGMGLFLPEATQS